MTDHVDMSQFIAARSDQLNADDLLDSPRTITITKVTASPDSAEQPVSVYYEGDEGKPFKPCKTVRRIMVGVWGKDASQYVGRSMTLYRDPSVAFGGMQVGGLRVSHVSHITEKKTVALQVTRGRKAPYTVHPIADAPRQAEQQDDPATKWGGQYIAKLATFTTLAELQAFTGSKAAKLNELKSARPDLYDRCGEAVEQRISQLGTSGFDDDMDDSPHPASALADKIIGQAQAAETVDVLGAIEAEHGVAITSMPDEIASVVKGAIETARTRLAVQA